MRKNRNFKTWRQKQHEDVQQKEQLAQEREMQQREARQQKEQLGLEREMLQEEAGQE